MDINYCKEKGCLSSTEKFNADGSKYQAPVCGLSGEDITKKKCHIYDEVSDMKVKFNRITISKDKTFKESDLILIRESIAKGLGVEISDVYFNYSRIGE